MTVPTHGHEIAKLRSILREIGDDSLDQETVQLIIEGETKIPEIGAEMIEAVNELAGQIEGCKAAEGRLKARRDRLEARSEAIKDILFAMASQMNASCTTPVGTFGVRHYKTVEYLDESKVPNQYRKKPEPQLDKRAVSAALNAGLTVPGACLAPAKTLAIKV